MNKTTKINNNVSKLFVYVNEVDVYTMRSVKYIHGDTKHMLINHNLSAHDTEQM